MTVETTDPRGRRAGTLARGTALAVVLALAGCSYVPDWANPVSWYDSVASDEAPPPEQDESAMAKPVPGADKSFPTLASVPDRPNAPTPSGERQKVQQGLVADRENAKYTEQVANAAVQQEAANTAPPPPPPAASATTMEKGSKPPTLGAVPPAPPPPAASTVAQADNEPAKRMTPPPPPPMPAAPAPSSDTMPAPSETTPPPSTASLSNLPDGYRRMAVPQIVQESPSSPPLKSGGASASPAVAATTPPQVPGPATVPPPPPAIVQPTLPSQARAATPPTTPPAMPTAATPKAATPPAAPPAMTSTAPAPAMTAAAPATSAVEQRLNLPVAPDQQALNETFARNVAAQQGMTVATVPTGDVGSGGTVYVGGSPGRPGYATTTPPSSPGLGAPQAGLAATVHFGHGSSSLSAKAQREIRKVAAEAKRSGRTVRVVGHSSQRTGNMSFERHLIANFDISLDRANHVAQALARAGVDGSRIVVEAVGDTQPLYFEFMPNGEAENRRAEIFLE